MGTKGKKFLNTIESPIFAIGLPAVVLLLTLCCCRGPAEDGTIQITQDDILTLQEWPVESWEPLFLKDGDDDYYLYFPTP